MTILSVTFCAWNSDLRQIDFPDGTKPQGVASIHVTCGKLSETSNQGGLNNEKISEANCCDYWNVDIGDSVFCGVFVVPR